MKRFSNDIKILYGTNSTDKKSDDLFGTSYKIATILQEFQKKP